MTSVLQHGVLLDVINEDYPELFIKLVGTEQDLEEFHHELWKLPFYQKLVRIKTGFNTTKYLYLSDRNVSSSSLFFIYELSHSKLSLKGTYNIEKRIIDVKEKPEEFKKSLELIMLTDMANHVPSEIWNYTTLL